MLAMDHPPPAYFAGAHDALIPPPYDDHKSTLLLDGASGRQDIHVSRITQLVMTSKPDRTLRLPWQSKARNVDNSTPKTPRMVSRIEVAKRAHHHAIQARVAARKASQIEIVLPNDFCGVLVVHDAFGQPHLGYLLSQDAREYITSPFAATSPGSALYDVRPQAVVMALVYRSMQAPFRKARRSEDLRDVCEVFADGAAVCVRYAAEARSQDMKNWYESLLSSVLSDRSSD